MNKAINTSKLLKKSILSPMLAKKTGTNMANTICEMTCRVLSVSDLALPAITPAMKNPNKA
jgi:hypothetical protein